MIINYTPDIKAYKKSFGFIFLHIFVHLHTMSNAHEKCLISFMVSEFELYLHHSSLISIKYSTSYIYILGVYMRMRLFVISRTASANTDITFRYLHPDDRLFSAIHILDNESILVFWVFFRSLLMSILNGFENNLGWFLVFWDCFIFYFFKP